MKITQKELQEMVRVIVDKKMLAENYMATRKLEIMARDFALGFEAKIVSELGLSQPDEMEPMMRARYHEAMKTMGDKIVAAVIDAIAEVKNLPKPPAEV